MHIGRRKQLHSRLIASRSKPLPLIDFEKDKGANCARLSLLAVPGKNTFIAPLPPAKRSCDSTAENQFIFSNTSRLKKTMLAKPSASVHAHHMVRHLYSVRKAVEDQEARTFIHLKTLSRCGYAYRNYAAVTV